MAVQDDDDLLTTDEVAGLLHVERSWVVRHAANGELPHLRIGRFLRFRRVSIMEWIREREEAARAT